jgi:hypothetical protein
VDQYLPVRCRGQPKERIKGNGGFRKKLAAARGGMTRCALPAQLKGHRRQEQGKDNIVQGTREGRTIGRRSWATPECNNGIRNRDQKEWLRLGSERTSCRIFEKTIGLQIVKRISGSSFRIGTMSVRTLWRSRPLRNERRDH